MTDVQVKYMYTLCLAASARGASFLIGDAGISIPRIDIVGMRFIYYLTIYDLLFNRVFIGDIAITLSLKLQM